MQEGWASCILETSVDSLIFSIAIIPAKVINIVRLFSSYSLVGFDGCGLDISTVVAPDQEGWASLSCFLDTGVDSLPLVLLTFLAK